MLQFEQIARTRKGDMPLSEIDQNSLLKVLSNGWSIEKNCLVKKYSFSNYSDAFKFVEKVSSFSDLVNHHHDIQFGWGYVELRIWTHVIKGLHRNDFIWAAKVDRL